MLSINGYTGSVMEHCKICFKAGILWISILEIALAFLSLTLEISVEHPMIKLTKKSLRTYVVAYESSIAIPEEIKFMCSSVRE